MWTVDMNRCQSCSTKTECADRKKILKALSPVINEINLDDENEHPDGVIIVSCRR
jgi:hypothetical protein